VSIATKKRLGKPLFAPKASMQIEESVKATSAERSDCSTKISLWCLLQLLRSNVVVVGTYR
jgi:hypothetical protein